MSLVSVEGTAAGGDLGAAEHPGWALADEIEAATFTNLLMLGFDPALMERKHATSFHRRMFRKTNAKGMGIVLRVHFLMQRLEGRMPVPLRVRGPGARPAASVTVPAAVTASGLCRTQLKKTAPASAPA